MVKQPMLMVNENPPIKAPRLGKFVKLQHENAGRFWVKVVKKTNGQLFGRVDNKLLGSHGFDIGDIIIFKLENIVE